MTWKLIVRSEVGTSHEKRQIPCQDYGECTLIEHLHDTVVGAIADGSGSAEHSDVGSEIAVKAVLSDLPQYLDGIDKDGTNLPQLPSKEKAQDIFEKTFKTVLDKLNTKANESSYRLQELACTLIAFVATPEWVAAMQIGDGFIVVHSPEDSKYQLLFKPNKGEYANQTTFVTSSNALSEMKVTVLGHRQFICASTDGLERVALNICDWTPGEIFFEPLEQYVQMSTEEEAKNYIKNFLQSQKLNSRTDDDKTLLVCLYDKGINPQPSSSKIEEGKLENSPANTDLPLTLNTEQFSTNDNHSDEQTNINASVTLENTDEPVKSSPVNSSSLEENSKEFLSADVHCEKPTDQISISSVINNPENPEI